MAPDALLSCPASFLFDHPDHESRLCSESAVLLWHPVYAELMPFNADGDEAGACVLVF
jgi:hypothetical protein